MRKLLLFVILLTSCSAFESKLSLSDVQSAFKNLPVQGAKVLDQTNSNIGRPNEPLQMMIFKDDRARIDWSPDAIEVLNKQMPDFLLNCSIRVFENSTLAKERKDYLDSVSKALPPSDYIYLYKNVIVMLDHGLQPEHAEEYKKALESL